jgi:hypothetical protein
MVVYAGAAGAVLAPTPGTQKLKIRCAVDALHAGGSTAGGEGLALAYKLAQQSLDKAAVNRVILMTDGDFNVGISDAGELTRLIEERAKSGVFLSVLGFGMGNLKDGQLEALADTVRFHRFGAGPLELSETNLGGNFPSRRCAHEDLGAFVLDEALQREKAESTGTTFLVICTAASSNSSPMCSPSTASGVTRPMPQPTRWG